MATIIEFLPSLRTSDLKHWNTVSNQCIAGKDNSLLPYRVRYELTREGLVLDFIRNGFAVEQFIEIQIEPSNLGRGEVWHFLCPDTGIKCRKLVLWQGEFVHQSSIRNSFYRQQTESAPERTTMKWIRKYKKYKELEAKQMQKYYKPMYDGRNTRLAVRASQALLKYADAVNNEAEVFAWIRQKSDPQKSRI